MTTASVARRARSGRRDYGAVGLVALALLAGALVVALEPRGVIQQTTAVLLLGLCIPVVILFIARPHLAVAAYLTVLPLLLPWSIAAGLNAGEMFTLAMIVVGTVSLWEARGRLGAAIQALAPIVWPLLLLALISVVSLTLNGITAFQEIAAALFKMLAFGIIAVLVHIHADTPKKAKHLWTAVLLGGAGVAIYSVVAYLLGWSYSAEYDWNRASGTFEHWNQLGGFMALISMPTLALAVTGSVGSRMLYAFAFALEITALLLSLTLGSVLALVVGGIVAAVFLIRIGWRRIFAASVLMAISFAIVLVTNEAVRDKFTQFDERVLDRLRTYAVGVAMFRDRLWFGFGSEERVTEELWFGEADYGLTVFGASSSIPHNSFIEMGVEKGVFGAVFFAVLIIGALLLVFRHRSALMASPHSLLYQGTIVGILAFMVQNLTNTLVLHARIGIIFFALVALLDQLGVQAKARAARPAADGVAMRSGAASS